MISEFFSLVGQAKKVLLDVDAETQALKLAEYIELSANSRISVDKPQPFLETLLALNLESLLENPLVLDEKLGVGYPPLTLSEFFGGSSAKKLKILEHPQLLDWWSGPSFLYIEPLKAALARYTNWLELQQRGFEPFLFSKQQQLVAISANTKDEYNKRSLHGKLGLVMPFRNDYSLLDCAFPLPTISELLRNELKPWLAHIVEQFDQLESQLKDQNIAVGQDTLSIALFRDATEKLVDVKVYIADTGHPSVQGNWGNWRTLSQAGVVIEAKETIIRHFF